MTRLLVPAALLGALLACGGADTGPSVEEQVQSKCPRVHMDKLAGDWVSATGDTKVRFRVVEDGERTLLWLSDPSFSNHKLELVGTRRDKDWQFDELPRGKRKAMIAAGGESPKRVYLAPKAQRCALEVFQGAVTAEGKEVLAPKPKEFLQFPETAGLTLTYRPHDEPLFLADAAKDPAVADKEIAELGEPRYESPAGAILTTAWTDAAADGAEGCTFSVDAWFDDQPVEGGQDVAAGEPVGGRRPWSFTFDAPYTGSHRLELHRHRTCGGTRELVAVAGLEVLLP